MVIDTREATAPEGRRLSDAELKALARTVTVRVHCYQ